jgi:hypothetical protein
MPVSLWGNAPDSARSSLGWPIAVHSRAVIDIREVVVGAGWRNMLR